MYIQVLRKNNDANNKKGLREDCAIQVLCILRDDQGPSRHRDGWRDRRSSCSDGLRAGTRWVGGVAAETYAATPLAADTLIAAAQTSGADSSPT